MFDTIKNIFKSDIPQVKPLHLDFYLSSNGRRVMITVPIVPDEPNLSFDQNTWEKLLKSTGLSSLLQGQLQKLTNSKYLKTYKDQKSFFITRFNFVTGVAIDQPDKDYLPKLKELMSISRDDIERCRQYISLSQDLKLRQEFSRAHFASIVGQLIMVAIDAKKSADYSKAVAILNILLELIGSCQEQFQEQVQRDPTMFTDLSCFLEQYHPELTNSVLFIYKTAFTLDNTLADNIFKVFQTQVKNNPTRYVKSTDFFTHIAESTENICYAYQMVKFVVALAEVFKSLKPDVLQQINTEDFINNQIYTLEQKLKDGVFTVEKSKFIPQMQLFYSFKKKNASSQVIQNPNITYEFNYPCSYDRVSRGLSYLSDKATKSEFDEVKQKLHKQIMKLRSVFGIGLEIQNSNSCNSEMDYSDEEPEIIESLDQIKYQSKRDSLFKSISRIQPDLTQEQIHVQANLRVDLEELQEENKNLKQINMELKMLIEQKEKELQEIRAKQEMQAKIELHNSTQSNIQTQIQSRSQLLLSTMNFGKGSNNQLNNSKPIDPIKEEDEKTNHQEAQPQQKTPPPPPPPTMLPPPPPPPPPPKLSGGPPPPPPPMGGGFLPPPPNSKPAKKRQIPSVPVKKLTWQVLDPAKVDGTIWDGLASVELDEVMRKEIEENFQVKVPLVGKEKATPLKPAEERKQKISKLDPRRQQSILLALKKLNVSTEILALALRQIDRKILTDDNIDHLVRVMPVEAELKLWNDITEEEKDLQEKFMESDLFCIEILKVQGFSQRILSLQFQSDFEQGSSTLLQQFVNILTNFESLLVDKKIPIILRYVLSVGNFLNGENNLGGAYGASLDSIVKIELKSDNNPQQDFWVIVVKQIEKKYPNFVEITENLTDLEILSKTNYEDLVTQLKYYNTSLRTVVQAMESHDDLDDKDQAYYYFETLKKTIESFLVQCQDTQDKIKEKSGEAFKFYGCPPRFTQEYFFELIFKLKKKLKDAKIKIIDQDTKRKLQEFKKLKTAPISKGMFGFFSKGK